MPERSSFTATRRASLDWVLTEDCVSAKPRAVGWFLERGWAALSWRGEGVCWDCRGAVGVSDLSQPTVSAAEPITECLG